MLFRSVNRSFDRAEEARQFQMRNALAQQEARAAERARQLSAQLATRQQDFTERQAGEGNTLDLMRFEEARRQFDTGQGNEYGYKNRALSLEDLYRNAQMNQQGSQFENAVMNQESDKVIIL